MEDSQALHTPTRNWPPERGWPLFIAWMAGILAVLLLYEILRLAGFAFRPQSSGWSDRLFWVIPGVAGHAWQAWLLFRRYPVRFGLWSALPLIQFAILDPRYMEYLGLVVPLLEAAILRNVRQRAWAWILASMAGVVLSGLFTYFAYGAAQSLITKLTNEIASNFGSFASTLQIGMYRGVWLLGEALCAAVLAWKMAPVNQSPAASPESLS
jgi:hypothetical protein